MVAVETEESILPYKTNFWRSTRGIQIGNHGKGLSLSSSRALNYVRVFDESGITPHFTKR